MIDPQGGDGRADRDGQDSKKIVAAPRRRGPVCAGTSARAFPAALTGRAWMGSSRKKAAQFVGQFLRGRVALARLFLQALKANRLQVRRNAGTKSRGATGSVFRT